MKQKSNSELQSARQLVDTVAMTVKLKQKSLLNKAKYRADSKSRKHSKVFLKGILTDRKEIWQCYLLIAILNFFLFVLCGKKRKYYIGDFQEKDMTSPAKACHDLNMAKNCKENTAKILSADLDVANMRPFLHPITKNDVYILLDPSHMLKLVRNTLGSKQSIWHPTDGFIEWKFIERLEKPQNAHNLLAGTKLRRAHIEWYWQKIKDLKHPDFQGTEATAKFLRIFNDIFDLFNARNLLGRGFKRPQSLTSQAEFSIFMEKAELYIEDLKTAPNGLPILESNQRTGVLGFLICLHSISSLFKNLIKIPIGTMSFLMTCKFSQDHLEMFFSAIRRKGGYNNNNPTCKQFQAAYIRFHVDIISGGNENCIALDDSSILEISSAINVYRKFSK
ncbi:DNA transposase THAP9 like protein [Argiope bruennichi]|uniref:DNA transposase THAP9 like protein n=1 Tax=Argiope bruennichi TaxID=94029 RepID=A0A8T0EXR2_ARGBR|nr:DNA transposase THAP9 like protein [Argiope bruennichi]